MLVLAARSDRSDAALTQWWSNGGEATLEAYGVDDPSEIPADHLAWIRRLPPCLHENDRFFVHAGVRPGVPLIEQSAPDMLWIREPFLGSEDRHGALVVHGHTPTRSGAPDLRANHVNLDTGPASPARSPRPPSAISTRHPSTFSTATACNSNWHRSGATRFECE